MFFCFIFIYFNKINVFFKKIYIYIGITSKITSFASDGASVMLGKRNGVAAKIAERNPYLFTTHCIAHRLALACNSAENQVSFCKHVENIMKSIYSFFSSSSKRQEILRQYQTVLDHPILKI